MNLERFCRILLLLLLAAPVATRAGAGDGSVPAVGRPDPAGANCSKPATGTGDRAFPRQAAALGLERGDALIVFTMAANGEITDVRTVRASHPVFAEAAEQTVRQYRCRGVGRVVEVQVPFAFRLEPTASAPTAARAPSERHALRGEAPTGSNIGRRLVTGPLPLDKPYAALSHDEQEHFKSIYEPMAPGDEPPFPLHGLRDLYEPLAEAQRRLEIRDGLLEAEVRVDADGRATRVDVLHQPSPEMGTFAAQLAMAVRFKPAVCAGRPCAMAFPVRMRFEREL